jgi:hypothetical protein
MIDRKAFAKASRDADKYVENRTLQDWCIDHDTDIDGLLYVAQQQAIRAGMIIDGADPTSLPADKMSTVHLSEETMAIFGTLQGCVVNGIVIGMTVEGRDFGLGGRLTR